MHVHCIFPPIFVKLFQGIWSFCCFFYLKEKCAPYWPNSSTTSQQQHGEITVTLDSEIDRSAYVITKLYISHGKVCNLFSTYHFISSIVFFYFSYNIRGSMGLVCDSQIEILVNLDHPLFMNDFAIKIRFLHVQSK